MESGRHSLTSQFAPRRAGGRFRALDGWRGLCALGVCIFHFKTVNGAHAWLLFQHAYLFVDFFFVLSGFVLTYAYFDTLDTRTDVQRMIWRRMGRLWPLHIAILAAFVALELVTPALAALTGVQRAATIPFDPTTGADAWAIPAHIFLVNGLGLDQTASWNVPSWSISVEFWIYFIFAGVALAGRRYSTVASAIIIAAGLGILVARSPHYMAVESGLGFLRCAAGFFIGHLVYLLFRRVEGRARGTSAMEIAAVGGTVAFVMYAAGTPFEYAAPFVFAVAIFIFALEDGTISKRFLNSRPLQALGLWSYSIYMVHSLVIAVCHRGVTVISQFTGQSWVVANTGGERILDFGSPLLTTAVTAAFLMLVIMISAATWRWIEQPAATAWNGPLWRWLARTTENARPATRPAAASGQVISRAIG